MAAKAPFRLFAFIQDLHWKFLERVPQSDSSCLRADVSYFLCPFSACNKGNRRRLHEGNDSSCGQFFCFPRVFEMSHLIIAFHRQNFKVELPSCRVWTKLIFFRRNCSFPFFHSKNGQLKCPNTKLLVLLVTADRDCRLIFSIWWINRADQQSDQRETEI